MNEYSYVCLLSYYWHIILNKYKNVYKCSKINQPENQICSRYVFKIHKDDDALFKFQ